MLVSIILTQQLPYHIAVNEFFIDSVEHLQNQNVKYIIPSQDSIKDTIIPIMVKKVYDEIKKKLNYGKELHERLMDGHQVSMEINFLVSL